MRTVLINTKEIESCWESDDICFVKTNTGKVWLCTKKHSIYNVSTKEFIKNSNRHFVELTLADKGKSE